MAKVEKVCKTLLKTMLKRMVKLCVKINEFKKCVKNYIKLHIFNTLNTLFLTAIFPLSLTNVFHFSTAPTTTINNLYINSNNRKD